MNGADPGPAPGGAWTTLGPGLLVRQSREFWMNSVVLRHPEHTIVVDPGVVPSELDDLARETGSGPLTLLFTHGDWDHVLGRPWWPDAATLAHDRLAAEVRRNREEIAGEAAAAAARAGERWTRGFAPFRPDTPVSGLRFLRLGPWRLVCRDAPGHSASMLTIHLPEQRTLIAGDMLSDLEIPILQQPCAVYRRTLLELQPLAERGAIELLIPGHGTPARGAAAVVERLRRDLGYLEELERRVRAARAAGRTAEQAEAELAEMDYLGKRADYSMVENHRHNVRLACAGIAATASNGSRSAGRHRTPQ